MIRLDPLFPTEVAASSYGDHGGHTGVGCQLLPHQVRHHRVVEIQPMAPTSAGACRKVRRRSWKIDVSNDPARSSLPDGSDRVVLR